MSLFWKILLGFWLSLLLMALGAGAVVAVYNEAKQSNPDELAQDKRALFILDRIARELSLNGTQHLHPPFETNFAPGPRQIPFDMPNPDRLPQDGNPPPPEPPRQDEGMRHPDLTTENGMPPRPERIMPLIVNEKGKDLFGRTVPVNSWHDAQELSTKNQANQSSYAREVQTPDGKKFLIFLLNRMLPTDHFTFWMQIIDTPLILPLSALISSLIFSTMLARYLVRPIRILRDGLHHIAEGDFKIEVSNSMGHRHDELGQLGRDADRMAFQLEQLMQSQKRLLHDISHDLRSPLARLQVAIGLVRQNPERLEAMLDRLEHEARRLNTMISEILILARLESGVPYPQEDFLDLGELLQGLIEDARFESPSHQILLNLPTKDGEWLLPCRGELLWRAFENLLRNALQHTPEGASVTLSLGATVQAYTISIADTGPGVPEKMLQEIFEPFHHAGNTRGHGLGLAIAKRAIEAHGGTILAHNAHSGGLVIQITLPRGKQPTLVEEPARTA